MDITESLAPTSDQLDAVELAASGPRTFTIEGVSKGSIEQPVEVHLVGFPRVWRPSKGMRRTLASGWGVDASKWVGRSVTLFCDPNVSFGKERTGGTRIAAMSDLPGDKPLSVPLLVSRGKSQIFTVQPLREDQEPKRTQQSSPKPTQAQMKRLGEGFTAAGITDGEGKARFIAETIGRTPAGWDDLTPDDVAKTIDALAELAPAADTLDSFAGEG